MDRPRLPYRGPLVAKLVLGIAIIATPYMAFAVDQLTPPSPPQSGGSTDSKSEKSASTQEVIDSVSTSTSTTY